MENAVISQEGLFKLFYERKTLSWVQLGEMFSFSGTNENSRSVLGAIGNLVVEGYVEKLPGITPPIWKITKSGISNFTGRPLSGEETDLYNLQMHDVGSDLQTISPKNELETRFNESIAELNLKLEVTSARAKRSYLLSQISLAIAVLCVVIPVILSKCHI